MSEKQNTLAQYELLWRILLLSFSKHWSPATCHEDRIKFSKTQKYVNRWLLNRMMCDPRDGTINCIREQRK